MAREYKDSGIEWIGQIPKEWECTCFKRFHNDANVGESIDKYFCSDNENDTLFYTAGLKPIHTTYKDFPTWKYTSNNDLLLARNGTPYVYLPLPESIYSDHIIRVGIKEKYIREYARYCIQQAISFVVVDAVSIATWSISLWDKQFLPIPSLHEQQKIADYLDKICGEVDEMVALQETMIEELKAYKQSVITEAVTKGLNPAVPMRNSGIDWIGEIPEHWEQHQFRRVFEIKKIIAGTLGYDVLSVTQNGLKVKDLTKNEGQIAQDYSKYQLVDVDDYVMNHMDLLTGYVDCSKQNGVTSPDYRVFRAIDKSEISLAYYLKIFQTCYKEKIFYHLGQGVSGMGRWRLPAEQLKLFVLPMPPLSEQQQIASYLDTKCSEIDALIALKQAKIEELKEYKKSVIYEYVTGKKEVE